MLYRTAVYPATLELLKQLMELEALSTCNLVGGTALALQLGHRISVDLDLFGKSIPEPETILEEIRTIAIPEIEVNQPGTLILTINEIKVDIIRYPYDLLEPILIEEGIRMLNQKDIVPMKLSAVSGRGAKKDFFDLAILLDNFSLDDMVQLFTSKFPDVSPFHIIKSLLYFDDAEEDGDPIMLIDLTWSEVKHKIEKAVKTFLV